MNLDSYITHHNGDNSLTYGQYERYISGWKATKLWYHKGCSIAYFDWAENKHESGECVNVDTLKECWKLGLALKCRGLRDGDFGKNDWQLHATAEQLADYILNIGILPKEYIRKHG